MWTKNYVFFLFEKFIVAPIGICYLVWIFMGNKMASTIHTIFVIFGFYSPLFTMTVKIFCSHQPYNVNAQYAHHKPSECLTFFFYFKSTHPPSGGTSYILIHMMCLLIEFAVPRPLSQWIKSIWINVNRYIVRKKKHEKKTAIRWAWSIFFENRKRKLTKDYISTLVLGTAICVIVSNVRTKFTRIMLMTITFTLFSFRLLAKYLSRRKKRTKINKDDSVARSHTASHSIRSIKGLAETNQRRKKKMVET